MLDSVFLFLLFPISGLEPTLGRVIHIRLFVFLQFGKKRCNTIDGSRLAFLGRIIRGFDPSQRRSWGEKGQQIRWKFVGHDERRRRWLALK